MAAVIPVEMYERLVAERRSRFEVIDEIRSCLPDVSAKEIEKDAILVPGLSVAAGAIPEDPTDEMFLSAALDAKADCIVSGDRHFLDLGEYQGISILTAHHILKHLEKPPSS
jgi:predicted nucleic acid-binding protein